MKNVNKNSPKIFSLVFISNTRKKLKKICFLLLLL